MFTGKKMISCVIATACVILTETDSVHTLSLFHEAVNFVHLCHRGLRPAFLLDDWLHLVTKFLDILRIGCQVVERLSKTLKKIVVRLCFVTLVAQPTFEDV